jgi:hypothetical protein
MPASFSTLHSGVVSINNSTGDVSITVPSSTAVLLVRTAGIWVDMSSVGISGNAGSSLASVNDGNSRLSEAWEIFSPASGSQTLALRTASGTSRDYYVQVEALIGVGTARTPVTYSGFAANRSVSLTTVAADLVFDNIITASSLTVGGGRTTQYVGAPSVTGGGNVGLSSITASGTTTVMDWTHTSDWTALFGVAYPDTSGGGGSSAIAAISSGYHNRGLR